MSSTNTEEQVATAQVYVRRRGPRSVNSTREYLPRGSRNIKKATEQFKVWKGRKPFDFERSSLNFFTFRSARVSDET